MAFKLIKTKNNLNNIYDLICKNIVDSIFLDLGFNFFKDLVLNNTIHVYTIKNKSKISAILTIINYNDYKSINKIVIKYLIFHPIKFLIIFFRLLKAYKKRSNFQINYTYLHLLHLVIFKNDFRKITLKKKDLMFDKFFKKILNEHKSKVLFLCFDKKNIKAKKFYTRNKFKIFYKIKDIFYFKKEFNI